MKFLKSFLLTLLLGLLQAEAFAIQTILRHSDDTLTVRVWDIDDGLPVNTINTMVQDEEGYLWISTYDGLVRFDGTEFEVFNHANTPVIPHNRMTNLYHQKGVGTWISLEYGGILLYKDDEFYYYGREEGLIESDILRIEGLSDGSIFLITNKGLYKFDNGRFYEPEEYHCADNNYVYDIYEDPGGGIWSSGKGCIIRIDREGNKTAWLEDDPEITDVYSLIRHSDGKLYAGTNSGLFVLSENQEFNFVRESVSLRNVDISYLFSADDHLIVSASIGLYTLKDEKLQRITTTRNSYYETTNKVFKDREGKYWLTSNGGQLLVFDKGEFYDLSDVESLSGMAFNNFYQDLEGNYWLLTTRSGLVNLRSSSVKTIGVPEGLSGGNILGLLEDSRGRYWVGTRGNGLNMIDGDRIVHYGLEDGLRTNTIHSVLEDHAGNIWVGNAGFGIDKITNERIKHYDVGDNVESNDIRALFQDKKGNIWIGSYQGLILFDPVKEDHQYYTRDEGISSDKIRYITEDTSGALWVATLDAGISRYKNGVFTNYGVAEGMSSNNIRSLYADEKDPETLWVGTENNGLNRFKDGEFRYVNMEDGLPDYNIHWISQDENGWLWCLSNKGIFRINKDELNDYMDGRSSDFRIDTYGTFEGMRNAEGNGSFQEAGIRASDGRFWFATQEGVAIIDSRISQNAVYAPPVVIKEVLSGQQQLDPDSIVVTPDMEVVRVSYEVLSFSNSGKNRFRYRLNEDEEWVMLGKSRQLVLSGISPGAYSLQIEATDSQGAWSPKAAIVPLRILPKIYQQFWFYLLILFIAVCLYYVIVAFRTRILLNRQKKMKSIIEGQTLQIRQEKAEIEVQKQVIEEQAEHLSEANKTKDRFFSIIAHDLRNPFQAMVSYSDMTLQSFDSIEKKEIKERLQVIKDSSEQLLGLTNNLLSWANLQTGKIMAVPEELDLSEVIAVNESLAIQSALQKNIELTIQVEDEICVKGDPNMIDTVIRNILSNAMKFTTNGGKVMLKAYKKGNVAVIEVKDSGIGMSKKMLENLLSLDSNMARRGTENEPGTGLGLLLCKEMLEMNDGSISIESEEGKGTSFFIRLPLCRQN